MTVYISRANTLLNVCVCLYTVNLPFKVSLSGHEHLAQKNLKWMKFNTEILDLGSLKLINERKS
jgi:hypothetical protein